MSSSPLSAARICRRHNLLCLLKAFGWLLVMALAWPASWGLLYGLVVLLTLGWMAWSETLHLAWIIAWAGMAVLVVEGVFLGKRAFDLEQYRESLMYRAYAGLMTGDPDGVVRGAGFRGNRLLGGAWLLGQFLLVAPRSVVYLVQSLRRFIFMNAQLAASGDAIIQRLAADDRWTPVAELHLTPNPLPQLASLKAIRHRLKDGVMQVRLDSDLRDRLRGTN